MKTDHSPKPRPTPLTLSSTDEKIIRMIGKFRFAGALDVAHYLFSPTSLTYVRSLLTSLAGGEDHKSAQYLYRFRLPSSKTGGTERIYTLGSRGRDYLTHELGLPVDWVFRPSKLKRLSYTHAQHNLLLTRFCVAARSFCRRETHLRLAQTRLCYELSREPAHAVEVGREATTEKLKVIPDAWVCFERLKNGAHERFIPVLLEIDRGMEYQQKFKQHVRSRIDFVRSNAYSKMFGTKAVIVACHNRRFT